MITHFQNFHCCNLLVIILFLLPFKIITILYFYLNLRFDLHFITIIITIIIIIFNYLIAYQFLFNINLFDFIILVFKLFLLPFFFTSNLFILNIFYVFC